MSKLLDDLILEKYRGKPDYILTYTKTKFYPLAPKAEEIEIVDIAHALSLMTRANGHFKNFYSVGQHSINCYKEAEKRGYSKRIQLGCLLHDGSESYLADITRPVKKNLTQYISIEEKLQGLIYEKYGLGDLSEEEQGKIKAIDDAILYYEFVELMEEKLFEEVPFIAMEHDFSFREFKNVEKEFVYAFERLTTEKVGTSYIGVDGCKSGWVAVNIRPETFEIEVFKSIEEICLKHRDSNSFLIDMPIGLPESEEEIRPEMEARKILSTRSSCVFNVPCRQAVYEEDYYEANEINKRILGKGLSKQSFGICSKIKEIDEFLEKKPEFKNKLIESHPEVCFAMLNFNGVFAEPMYENKKTEEGIENRLDLLSKYYEKTWEIGELIYNDPTFSRIKDDIIDALCLAVVGMIGYDKGFKSLPENPEVDKRGLRMQMVYS